MRVTELHLYPVKGAAGIAVQEWRLDPFGLEYDRRWMVVDGAGGFITQRTRPRLGLLRTALDRDALVLASDAGGEVRLPLEPEPGPARRVRVWADEVDAIDAGDAAAALLSAHLGGAARLVHMPPSTLRQVNPEYARPGDRVSFADAYPILLITQESLDELNRRLPAPVPMRRFRPNIVVAGATPHAEDVWRRIRVGSVACDVVKPCDRCVVTTIDPATSVAGREPLRTLATYRRWNGMVWFGQNLIHRDPAGLRVGDPVEVMESGAPRPPLEQTVAAR